ncbi:DUF3967 domain-containing protein [Bacillus toyonensis]|uniref:DUF3967 domain-containing protein n=1 Tax=Bacillus toyonensis TaxID=155322 RepID=UPI001F0DC068|nr:DUF3967 domain-containing protein [Bacillus toyonensis]MCH5455730.1 DUF3967 domain-containing protein [Bacillus toyonensis]HDR7471445.1 DUF3967 domain-containing protein [Bacillus toyonensis]
MSQIYWGAEVAKNLGIGPSTLRKYCLALEEAGYSFKRGSNNSRIFYYNDVATIEQLIVAMKKNNLTLDQAINLVMTNVIKNEVAIIEHIKALLERVKRLEQFNLELIQRFDQEIMREEQRDVQLMQVLREIQDNNRLIAALEQKKLFWSRLFGK